MQHETNGPLDHLATNWGKLRPDRIKEKFRSIHFGSHFALQIIATR